MSSTKICITTIIFIVLLLQGTVDAGFRMGSGFCQSDHGLMDCQAMTTSTRKYGNKESWPNVWPEWFAKCPQGKRFWCTERWCTCI
ncbi:hypothetical protein ZWY2020_000372 [Hordeum vulgare]|uniref:Hordoindoline-a n=1 Tax=Hordeum vulgare subsp. vulgare TaxID=112509 RepID=A0A8I6YHS0_HORVV|nr:hypothetical protein ZWY2020_000372 [Hordeum vulgare]